MASIPARSTPGRRRCSTAQPACSRAAAIGTTRPAKSRSANSTARSASGRSKTIFWPGGSARRPGRASRDDRPCASHSVHPPPVPPAGGQPGYRRPAPVSADDLRLMELIDRQYLARPFYGSRRMTAWLATQGHTVNRKRVQRLMRLMGLVAIYQRPNTSKAAPEHTKYPYLLGGLTIDRVNQVWCTDITYIPLARGFIY